MKIVSVSIISPFVRFVNAFCEFFSFLIDFLLGYTTKLFKSPNDKGQCNGER